MLVKQTQWKLTEINKFRTTENPDQEIEQRNATCEFRSSLDIRNKLRASLSAEVSHFGLPSIAWPILIRGPLSLDALAMSRALGTVKQWRGIIRVRGRGALGTGGRNLSGLSQQSSENAGQSAGSIGAEAGLAGRTKPSLFYRQIDVVLREGHKREKRALRREGQWYVKSSSSNETFPAGVT